MYQVRNSLSHTDNRKYFSGLSNKKIERKRQWSTWQRKWEIFGDVLVKKRYLCLDLMNSNMVKTEKFDHLHSVYHFSISLKISISKSIHRMYGHLQT